jgi:TRAP-type C4-dicarboxylate transport system permease small subunit
LEIVKKIERTILLFEKIVMIAVGLLLPGMITLGVFFRYVLKTDLYAIEEIEVFLAIWFYFMGTTYASYNKTQITADILQVMVKSFTIRKYLAIITSALTSIICIVFSYWCTDMMTYAFAKSPTTAVWKIPLIAQYLAVYLGLILMSLYAVRDFWGACKLSPERHGTTNG